MNTVKRTRPNVSSLPPRMRAKAILLIACGFGLAVIFASLCVREFRRTSLRLSVQFVGYTNCSFGMHAGVLQVSNACPFAVVRGRSPAVVCVSPAAAASYAPIGWNVLAPGETERVITEPIAKGTSWRFVVTGERLGDDSYGIGRVPISRRWKRQVAIWLQNAGVKLASPRHPAGLEFSTDLIVQ
jgi:hypothetical protein